MLAATVLLVYALLPTVPDVTKLKKRLALALIFAVALSAVSELFFMMRGVIYKDGANVLGHLYKVAAYLYLFHATVNEALRRPLERLEVQALREKETLNAAPDGVLWVDDSGRILMVNPAMETLTGYAPNELMGQLHLKEAIAQAMSAGDLTERLLANPATC